MSKTLQKISYNAGKMPSRLNILSIKTFDDKQLRQNQASIETLECLTRFIHARKETIVTNDRAIDLYGYRWNRRFDRSEYLVMGLPP